MKNYKIAVAGTGYVGLSLGVLFAQHHQVVAVDIVQAKVDMINNKKSPIQDDYIRYVHILQHPNFNGELRVGCVCAERMTDDYINPQKTERELKNRLNRKKNFMRREWQERNQGKYVLRYKGENITIMKSKFGAGWGVLYGGQSVFRYNNRRIDDFHTARLIAFDLFDEQHESRGEVQPYWDGMRWLYY